MKTKFILTISQLNENRRKHNFVFPSILIQFENGLNEFKIVFPSILIQLGNGPNEFYF